MDSLQDMFTELISSIPMTFMGISKVVFGFLIFVFIKILGSHGEKLEQIIFNLLVANALDINCAWMEPVILGTIVLLTILAVVAATIFNMLATRPDDIWSRSTLGKAFKEDGIYGMLRAVRTSVVSYFRQSWLCRLYRYVTSHGEVVSGVAVVVSHSLFPTSLTSLPSSNHSMCLSFC